MNRNNLLTLGLLATASLVFSAQPAKALTYTNGDLFLGFRASGGTGAGTSLLVDIGQASTYRDATLSFNLGTGSIAADLSAVFGASWYTRTDLYWGVAGGVTPAAGGDGNRTLYASRAETTPGIQATAWDSAGSGTQAGPVSKLVSLSSDYSNDIGTPGSNSFVLREVNSNSVNTWGNLVTNQAPGQTFTGNSFAYFPEGIEGNSASGVGASALDLFRMPTGTGPGSYEGTFTINSSGVVNFSTSVVPEPSTYALMGFGLAALVVLARRRKGLQLQS